MFANRIRALLAAERELEIKVDARWSKVNRPVLPPRESRRKRTSQEFPPSLCFSSSSSLLFSRRRRPRSPLKMFVARHFPIRVRLDVKISARSVYFRRVREYRREDVSGGRFEGVANGCVHTCRYTRESRCTSTQPCFSSVLRTTTQPQPCCRQPLVCLE